MIDKIDKEFYEYYIRDLSYVPESEWMRYIPKNMIAFIKPTLEYINFTYNMIVHILLSLLTDLTLPISQPFNFVIMVTCILIVNLILFPLNIVLKLAKFFKVCPKTKFFNEDWKYMLANGSEYFDSI